MNKWFDKHQEIMRGLMDSWLGLFSYLYIASLVALATQLELLGTIACGVLIVLPALLSKKDIDEDNK